MALAVVLLAVAPAAAEETEESARSVTDLVKAAQLSGSLRAAYWSSNRSLDDGDHFGVAALWLKSAPKLGPNASLLIDGWVGNQDLVHEEATTGELREAYLDLHLGALDLRIGKQIIVWGRADRLNPTDNLTPRDFTLLVPEDTDQRSGAAGIQATYHIGSFALTGVSLLTFEPHHVPVGRPPDGSTLGTRYPGNPVSQWAAKVDHTGGRLDWSLSYFDGFDPYPDLSLDRVRRTGVDALLANHRIRVVGADAASTVGPYGLRAEAAYTITRDTRGDNPEIKNPFFYLVVGGDRTFLDNLNINVQYIFRRVFNFQDPNDILNPIRRELARQENLLNNQIDAVQHSMSLRVSKKWLNDTLETEVRLILGFIRLDAVVRPKIIYAVTDNLKLTVGADVFRGDEHSFFGRLRDNTTAYAEIQRSF